MRVEAAYRTLMREQFGLVRHVMDGFREYNHRIHQIVAGTHFPPGMITTDVNNFLSIDAAKHVVAKCGDYQSWEHLERATNQVAIFNFSDTINERERRGSELASKEACMQLQEVIDNIRTEDFIL